MLNIITKIRIWLVGVAGLVALPAFAAGPDSTGRTRTTEATQASVKDAVEGPPPGSPEFGVLIIIGVVAFLIFIAWLVVRVGDDNGPRTDRTLA